MTRGGARNRSGPAADPNALRRDRDGGSWLRLPASGREGEPPPWPLPRQNARERAIWAELWSLPQAIAWEAAHEERAVALLTRLLREAELPHAVNTTRTLARQYMEALGLVGALARNRKWSIDEGVTAPTKGLEEGAPRQSARTRLKLVSDA